MKHANRVWPAAALAFPALMAGVLATTTVGPAHAGIRQEVNLQLIYNQPMMSTDASTVTWNWTVRNTGTGAAGNVIVTHEVKPAAKVQGVSKPCAIGDSKITCNYGTIGPGESRTGWVTTAAPEQAGTIRIGGRISWRESRLEIVPSGGSPSQKPILDRSGRPQEPLPGMGRRLPLS